MNEETRPQPSILLVHEGELADVRALLDDLGLAVEERPPRGATVGHYLGATVVVSTPQYLLDRLEDGEPTDAIRIAVMSGESRTLRSILSRGGIEWIVRRPVHPAALRLLILRCLYQGPEKRKGGRRVSVGAEVRLKSAWRSRRVLLAEISSRDCRVLGSHPIAVGSRLMLRIPQALTGGRALTLAGRVVRTARHEGAERPEETCLIFDPPSGDALKRLLDLISAHAKGPALLTGSLARRHQPEDPGELDSRAALRSIIVVGSGSESDAEAEAETEERRSDSRYAFQRRVIALGEQATRVLVGRDISAQGMRVDPTPALTLGQELQIAIHVPGHETPLVLDVRVERDDGDDGLLLGFFDLSPTAEGYLRDMINELPGLSAGDAGSDGDDEKPLVVSEILASTD